MSDEIEQPEAIELHVAVYGEDQAGLITTGFGTGGKLSVLLEFTATDEGNARIDLTTDVPFHTLEEINETAETLELVAEQLRSEQFQNAWAAKHLGE